MPDRRPSSSASPLLVVAGIALGWAAAVGAGFLAARVIVAPAPPPTASLGAINWPAPAPTALDRKTAITPIAPAPPIRLTDQDGRPFDLAGLRGSQVLVFFGYTHCPDVCPATLADVRDALARSPTPFKVVFVTIDPARDDVASVARYIGSYQAGFIGLTGTPAEIRTVADAWGIQAARIDSDSASGYAMAHTADTFLVDAAGRLRHRIWFGAGPDVIVDRVAQLAAEPMPSPPPATPPPPATSTPGVTAGPSPVPSGAVAAGIVPLLQTTIIRVGTNRLVLGTSDPANRELAWPDTAAHVTFRSATDPAAAPIEADAFQIWISVGAKGAWVVDATFPAAGPWTGTISFSKNGTPIGSADFGFTVKERGTTPAVGDPAPSIRTPIGADWGGVLGNISTDVVPDPRFYQASVDRLLAEGRPFVLTFYSPAYCPTTACGPLLKNLKKIADEFPGVAFVHVEPHVMTNYGNRLVPDWSAGELRFNEYAQAYGIPVEPFVFVVGADGRVAASFELIVGMDEIRAAIRAATGG